MELKITSTDQITSLDGVKVRVWQGVMPSGDKCHVFIHRIAACDPDGCAMLDRELQEQLAPGRYIPLAFIL
jgi:hypothetical protein